MPRLLALIVSLTLFPTGVAFAEIYQQLDFTFDVSNSAPEDPVSGSILITADETNNNLPTSIVSIDLTIDGYVYSLGEVGISTSGSTATIGGTVNGVVILGAGDHDFQIIYNASTGALSFFPFGYATPTSGPWSSIPPVPEWSITEVDPPAPKVPVLGVSGSVVLALALCAAGALRTGRRDPA